MQPQGDTDYKKMFSELIKKQILVLGPDITLAKVKNVPGIQVDSTGEVTAIQGDPQATLQSLINQFVELSGLIVKKTMESILTAYPALSAASLPVIMGATAPSASTAAHSSGEVLLPPPFVPNADTAALPQAVFSPLPADVSSLPKEPPSFSSSDMTDLNKALEQLANSPVSVDNKPGKDNAGSSNPSN